MMKNGIIVEIVADQYTVGVEGLRIKCKAAGKLRLNDMPPLVGDEVVVELQADGTGVVQEILPRVNFLQRPAMANLDQVIVVISADDPAPNWWLVDSILLMAEHLEVDAALVLNKIDLHPSDELLYPYAFTGYPCIEISAQTGFGMQELLAVCAGKKSVFAGQSGVGKSSILNYIKPHLALPIQEVSQKRGFGRHTTRRVRLISVGQNGFVADTPGFSKLTLPMISPINLATYFPEMAPFLGHCKFASTCTHHKEPGCAVKEGLEHGRISTERYQRYLMFLEAMRERERMQFR